MVFFVYVADNRSNEAQLYGWALFLLHKTTVELKKIRMKVSIFVFIVLLYRNSQGSECDKRILNSFGFLFKTMKLNMI